METSIEYPTIIELSKRISELEDIVKKENAELSMLKSEQDKYPPFIPDNPEEELKKEFENALEEDFKRFYIPKNDNGIFGVELKQKTRLYLSGLFSNISEKIFGKPGAIKYSIIPSSCNSYGEFNKFIVIYTVQYLNQDSKWHKGIKKYQKIDL